MDSYLSRKLTEVTPSISLLSLLPFFAPFQICSLELENCNIKETLCAAMCERLRTKYSLKHLNFGWNPWPRAILEQVTGQLGKISSLRYVKLPRLHAKQEVIDNDIDMEYDQDLYSVEELREQVERRAQDLIDLQIQSVLQESRIERTKMNLELLSVQWKG